MAISVVQVSPYDNQNLVPIDSKIEIDFSGPIDPFTILNGVSIYHNVAANWNGESASILDKTGSDISEVGQQFAYINYNYTIVGNKLIITPEKALDQNLEYFIQIVPGNDATRFLSQETTSPVVYTRTAVSVAEISVTSAFTGPTSGSYSFEFGLNHTFDLSFAGVYKASYTFVPNVPLNIGNLTVSINGTFDLGDTAVLSVFAPTGLTVVYKSKFTTSRYEEMAIKSSKIEDQLYHLNVTTLKIASSIPGCLSINNKICNPIIIKFNKAIDQAQDLSSAISIFKTNIETGSSKKITYYYKFLGTDSVKVYLVGLDHLSSVSDLPIYNPGEQYRMQDFYKLPTYKYDGTLENTEIAGLGI
jgi:hypothetical protein